MQSIESAWINGGLYTYWQMSIMILDSLTLPFQASEDMSEMHIIYNIYYNIFFPGKSWLEKGKAIKIIINNILPGSDYNDVNAQINKMFINKLWKRY